MITREEEKNCKFLDSMVHQRMSIREMEKHLNEYFNLIDEGIKLNRSSWWDCDEYADYNLIGTTEKTYYKYEEQSSNKTIVPFCDFDIYVLPTKERDEYGFTKYYITEVGYEFQ